VEAMMRAHGLKGYAREVAPRGASQRK